MDRETEKFMSENPNDGAAQNPSISKLRSWLTGLVILACVAGLYYLSRSNYLLFHGVVEVFGIVVAFAVFTIAWNCRRFLDNYYLLFVGIASLFVGVLQLIHILAFRGMGVLPGVDTNPATQIWVAARYLESLSLLVAVVFIHRRFNPGWVILGYFLVTVSLLASILYWNIFPVAFIEGSGLTPFKIISEYVVSLLFLGAIGFLIKYRHEFSAGVVRLLISALGVAIVAELAFTLYDDAYGIGNLIGHLFLVLSFFFLYKALVETGLTRPYELLFHRLKKSEVGLAKYASRMAEVNNRLTQEVNERKRVEEDLHRYASELERTNKELESFSYSVSHDLRAPLRTIDGFSQAVQEDYADKLDIAGKEYLARIRNATQLMSHLIDDMLKLSRVSRAEMNFEEVNLSDIAQNIVRDLSSHQPERRAEFTIAQSVKVQGDPILLRAVLQNLLENAWKFSGKCPQTRIEFGIKPCEGKETYFIKDNGAGFDPKYTDRLFQPFRRLHSETEYPGTGIGLATVQRIIHRHGGRIWAESEEGKGAIFYFTLA